jgi:hypothetical protein
MNGLPMRLETGSFARAIAGASALCCAALVGACSSEDASPGPSTGGAGSPAGGNASAGSAGQSASGGKPSGGGGGATSVGGMGQAGATPGGANGGGAAGAGGSVGKGGSAGSSGAAGTGTGGGGGSGGAGGAPACQGGKVVHFVYFVEADATYSESQRADIEKQAFNFQKFWFDQLGVTFYLNHPVVDVIMAEHDAEWYLTNPDGIHGSDDRWYRLGNVKNEVYQKLGIQNFDADHRVVNYPTSRHDGRVGGNFGGAWMDGDDLTCLANNGFNYPYDQQNSAHCTGHVAHEFGHVLGLDHEGPNDDCMQYGFYTNDANDLCSFSDANVAKILADSDNVGWFEAEPGETCVGK